MVGNRKKMPRLTMAGNRRKKPRLADQIVSTAGNRRKKPRLGSVNVPGYIELIMANILLRLPVASVAKCKSVTKYWYSLIREPWFAQSHFSSFPKPPKLMLYLAGDNSGSHSKLRLMDRDEEATKDVDLHDIDQSGSLELVCSFNGLICFTKLVGTDLGIQICNPITKDVLQVPKGMPCTITQSVGVVFAPDKNKYKVLRFFCGAYDTEGVNCKCECYEPELGYWYRLCDSVQCPVVNRACPFFPTNVCVGGRMCWLVWSEEDHEVPDHILSVDMDGNFSRVELPNICGETQEFNIFSFLTEFQGRLALVSVDDEETYVDVWALSDHDESNWRFVGYAALEINGFIDGINSIVSMGDKLLFVIKPGFATYFRFHVLDMVALKWKKLGYPRFRIGTNEPVVFPFTESLFRCDPRQYI